MMNKIDAVLALRRNGKLLLGRDQLKVLEAVKRLGKVVVDSGDAELVGRLRVTLPLKSIDALFPGLLSSQ